MQLFRCFFFLQRPPFIVIGLIATCPFNKTIDFHLKHFLFSVCVSGHVPLFFGDRQSAALRSRWTHSRRNIKPLKKKDIATGGFSAEKQAINKNRRKKRSADWRARAFYIAPSTATPSKRKTSWPQWVEIENYCGKWQNAKKQSRGI